MGGDASVVVSNTKLIRRGRLGVRSRGERGWEEERRQ
jgi:hypothetical protein